MTGARPGQKAASIICVPKKYRFGDFDAVPHRCPAGGQLTGRQWDFDLALPAVAAKSAEAICNPPSQSQFESLAANQQIAANELGPESCRANLLACFPLANFGHFDLAESRGSFGVGGGGQKAKKGDESEK